jgi:hypothetical protein
MALQTGQTGHQITDPMSYTPTYDKIKICSKALAVQTSITVTVMMHSLSPWHQKAQFVGGGLGCVFITAVPITNLFAWGEGDSGGHVLRETTSRGLCGLG